MFGWFQPKPPLAAWEKAWAEDRLCRLTEHFQFQSLLETPTLVPSYPGVPPVSDRESAEELLGFLKDWMRVDRPTHLECYSDSDQTEIAPPPDAQSSAIRVYERQFQNGADLLIPAFAWQLGQLRLEDTALSREPWAVDLFPVYCGLGIFAANTVVRETSKSEHFSWWSALQAQYLPARIFGYAIALREFVRGEASDVDLAATLRPDAATTYADGIAYLEKTKDTVFTRDLVTKPRTALSNTALLDEIQNGSGSTKIAALWRLTQAELTEPETARGESLMLDCIRDRDADVRAVAVECLSKISHSADAIQEILDALKDRNDRVRTVAAAAVGQIAYRRNNSGDDGINTDGLDALMIEELTLALQDDTRAVVLQAARSLTVFGESANPAVKALLKRLRGALNECNDAKTELLLGAIASISPEPAARLRDFFGEQDADYLAQSLELLAEFQASADTARES